MGLGEIILQMAQVRGDAGTCVPMGPQWGFECSGWALESGQVRGDGGRGSADFDAGGGDGAHGAVDTAGEEGHEREAAEIEARGSGETC